MEIRKSAQPTHADVRENKDEKHAPARGATPLVHLPSCAGIAGAVVKAFNTKPLKTRAVILVEPGLPPRITALRGVVPHLHPSTGNSTQESWPLAPPLALSDVKSASSAVKLIHQTLGSGPLPEPADLLKLGEALCASIQATTGSNLGWLVALACMELGARPELGPGALRSFLRPLMGAEGGPPRAPLLSGINLAIRSLEPILAARPKLLGAILKLIHESGQLIADPTLRGLHCSDRLAPVFHALKGSGSDLQAYALEALLRLDDLTCESMAATWVHLSLLEGVSAGTQSLVSLVRRLPPTVGGERLVRMATNMLQHAEAQPLQTAQAVAVLRVLLEWSADLPADTAQGVQTALLKYAFGACTSGDGHAGWLVQAIATAHPAPDAGTCGRLMRLMALAMQSQQDPAVMNSFMSNALAALQVQSARLGRDRTAAMLSAVLVADGAHLLSPALLPQQLWALGFLAQYAPQAALDHARNLLATSLVSVPSRVLTTLREGLLQPADAAAQAAGAPAPPLRMDPAGLAELYLTAIDSLEEVAPRAEFIDQEIAALQAHPQAQALAPVLATLRQARDQLLDQPGGQLQPASAPQDQAAAAAPAHGEERGS